MGKLGNEIKIHQEQTETFAYYNTFTHVMIRCKNDHKKKIRKENLVFSETLPVQLCLLD